MEWYPLLAGARFVRICHMKLDSAVGASAERTPCSLPDCAAVDAPASLASCLSSAERISILRAHRRFIGPLSLITRKDIEPAHMVNEVICLGSASGREHSPLQAWNIIHLMILKD